MKRLQSVSGVVEYLTVDFVFPFHAGEMLLLLASSALSGYRAYGGGVGLFCPESDLETNCVGLGEPILRV